jgi:hypothetical protein
MEEESGAKLGYSLDVHFSNEFSRTLIFCFQLWLFRICAPNVLKVAIEFISWVMVCNHLVMDAT